MPDVVRRGPGRPPRPRARPEDILGAEADEVASAARRPVVSLNALNNHLLQRVAELERRLSSPAPGPAPPLEDAGASAKEAGGVEAPVLSVEQDSAARRGGQGEVKLL